MPRKRTLIFVSIPLRKADYEQVRKYATQDDMLMTPWMRNIVLRELEKRRASRSRVAKAAERQTDRSAVDGRQGAEEVPADG